MIRGIFLMLQNLIPGGSYDEYQRLAAVFGYLAMASCVLMFIIYYGLNIRRVMENLRWIKKRQKENWKIRERVEAVHSDESI